LVEDLVAVLLRSDPEQRPTAGEVLSIPLVRPLADSYVHRINAVMDGRNGLPSLDVRRASVSDQSADDSNIAPRKGHRISDSQQMAAQSVDEARVDRQADMGAYLTAVCMYRQNKE
jgi:hypothetical protein